MKNVTIKDASFPDVKAPNMKISSKAMNPKGFGKKILDNLLDFAQSKDDGGFTA